MITGRSYFFRFCVTVRFFQPPYGRFLWNKCFFKRSPNFTLSPHYQCGAIANANAKFQNNDIWYYTYTYLKNFLSWFFYENVFYTLYFLTAFFFKASLKGHSLKRGPRTQDLRPRARKPGPGTQDSGPWTQNIELWTPGTIPSTYYLFSYASEGSKR